MRIQPKQVCMATAPGFTIVELVVSIGILGILMVVAGGVFALTLKSSGQATALIDIHQSLRALEDSLREDLRGVSPSGSILVIQSHAINSYWTDDAKEIDNNANPLDLSLNRDPQREKVVGATLEVERPRADMLMFFTSRPGNSFRDPEVSGTLQQVVYGHALPGEWNALTKNWTATLAPASGGFVDQYDESSFTSNQLQYQNMPYEYDVMAATNNPPVFAIPARDWHLARRGVLIVDQDLSNPPYYPAKWLDDSPAKVSGSEDDPEYSGLQKDYYVRDGRRDYLVDGVDPEIPEFVYQYDVIDRLKGNDQDSLYVPGEGPASWPAYDVDDANPEALVNWMPRSRLDYAPPSNQVDRMGQFFLPHCASFKVEWALNIQDVLDYFYGDQFYECRNDPGEDAPGKFPWAEELLWIDPANFAETIVKINDVRVQMKSESTDTGACYPAIDTLMNRLLSKLVPGDPTQTDPVPCNRANYETNRFLLTNNGSVNGLTLTHIFYPTKPFPVFVGEPASDVALTLADCVADQPDPLFPKALRITVDVYDPADRLERPIRHVMVLPVGQ